MNKKIILAFLFCIVCFKWSNAQHHSFEIKDGDFYYDNKPIQIHSGEMHFARVPQAYWRHRLKMMKAMGLNTVATYVFWNYHNTSLGVWDFKTGNRNITEFIRIAQEEGLFVILRPGPYACAEWEFGGYPWWLQKDTGLTIRTYNKPFLDSCRVYINKLAEQVKPLLITHGGPVIMVQAENEFGSYVAQRKDIPIEQHKKYNRAIKKMLLDAGLDVPLFTSDGSWLFDGGSLQGVLPAANGEGNIENLKKAVNKYHHNEGPYMVAEFYPGWLDHWMEPFQQVSTEDVTKQVETYLQNKISFNFYMVHGGTNFGFTSGANYSKEHDIQPDITSYDYDAPISESGGATPKYMAIRELMIKYVDYPVPEIPPAVPVLSLPDIKLNRSADFLEIKNLMKPVISDAPMTFEDLNQGYGYVLYSKKFTKHTEGMLEVNGLRDYAIVYVNGERVAELNRINKKYSTSIDIPANGTLDILVENMGRINYEAEIVHNRNGIISPLTFNKKNITGEWKMYKLPFAKSPDINLFKATAQNGRAALYSGNFLLDKTGDVFLDMSHWGKGIVFVNGHNLGRYWNAGPQQTLYLSGPFLKKGKNEIVVFEQININIKPVIPTAAKPVLTDLQIQ